MKKKLKELLEEHYANYWDEISEVEMIPMTDAEEKAKEISDNEFIKKVIKLFK